MATPGQLNDLLTQYRDAAFDSGYYQSAMEKTSSLLADETYKEYAMLNRLAIAKRQEIHKKIFNLLFPSRI